MNWHKKIAVVLLVFFYSASLVGLGWNRHYCHGELVKSGWFVFSHEDCCCSDEEDMGCCENETDFFRIKDDHLGKSVSTEIGNPFSKLLKKISSPEIILHMPRFAFNSVGNYTDLPPPDFLDQNHLKSPLFLTHCNFRL